MIDFHCSSQVWVSGAPAESQSRSSSTFQRTARPSRTGFGRRPSARRAHTCRTEIPRIFATSAAGTARQADSLPCVALLIPALLRARGTRDCKATVLGNNRRQAGTNGPLPTEVDTSEAQNEDTASLDASGPSDGISRCKVSSCACPGRLVLLASWTSIL